MKPISFQKAPESVSATKLGWEAKIQEPLALYGVS